MKVEKFKYIRHESLASVLEELQKYGDKAAVLGGGTELVVRMKQQVTTPEVVIDMRFVPELTGIVEQDGYVTIGAGTPLRAVEGSGVVRTTFAALAQAVHSVASMQIRNLATLGGNLCQENRCIYYNQSKLWKQAKGKCFKSGGETCYVMNKPGVCYATYRGDVAVALMALDSEVEIAGAKGKRWLPVADLYSGDGRTPLNLSPDELLTRVRVPLTPIRQSVYLKLSHRKVVDFPLVGLALARSSGTDVRVVVGGLSPAPVRTPEAEAILAGAGEINRAVLANAAEVLAKACNPVVDNMLHGSPGYRRSMVKVLLRRAWANLEGDEAMPAVAGH